MNIISFMTIVALASCFCEIQLVETRGVYTPVNLYKRQGTGGGGGGMKPGEGIVSGGTAVPPLRSRTDSGSGGMKPGEGIMSGGTAVPPPPKRGNGGGGGKSNAKGGPPPPGGGGSAKDSNKSKNQKSRP